MAAGQGAMTAVAQYGIAHSQLFKQASRPRIEVRMRWAPGSAAHSLSTHTGRISSSILASKDSGSEPKLHAALSADGMWKVQVAACCACSRRMGGMQGVRSRGAMRMRAEPGTKEADTGSSASAQEEGDKMDLDEDSESAQKQAEIERLRQAEKFMVVGTGEATCMGCGYEYQPKNGDPEYPITPGTYFSGSKPCPSYEICIAQSLPEDWNCPICGADKNKFQSKAKEIAGFAENQKYGLGTNSLTGGQKSLLIFGSLLAFFFLFLAGYFIQ